MGISTYIKLGAAVIIIAALSAIFWEVRGTYVENAELKVQITALQSDRDLAVKAANEKTATIAALEASLKSNANLIKELDTNRKEIIKENQRLVLKRHDYEGLREGNQRELVLKILNNALEKTSLEVTGNE